MAKSNLSDYLKNTRPIQGFSTGRIDIKTKPIEGFPKGHIDVKTKPVENFSSGTVDVKTKPIEDFTYGKIEASTKPVENFSYGTPDIKTKPIQGFTSGAIIQENNRPIQGFSGGTFETKTRPIVGFSSSTQIVQNYKKPIEKFSHNNKYKSENTKKYKKQSTITNGNKTIRNTNKQYKPHYPAKYFTSSSSKDDGVKTSKSRKEIDKEMKFNMNMTWGNNYANTAKNFDRLYSVYPAKEIDNICQYVFIVRPDLNILKDQNTLVTYSSSQIKSGYYPNESPSSDLYFNYMLRTYPMMLRNLSGNSFPGDHDFMPYLVSRTESMQIPDYSIKSYKFTQPYTNFNMPYASHGCESYTGGTFEITFREDNDYRIHKLFQTWLYYIDGVTRNVFGPKMKYIRNNRYDYMTSVYCITCAADGETIKYWTKYTGCFPTSVPHSDLSFNLRGTPNNKVTIPFEYFLQEPLDPYILVDFNKNAHVVNNNSNGLGYIPVYRSKTLAGIGINNDFRTKTNKSIRITNAKVAFSKNTPADLGSGNGLVGCPFICKVDGEYLLRWKKTNISI